MDSDPTELFHSLLEIGRAGSFDRLTERVNVPKHNDALRLADRHRDSLMAYAQELPQSDLEAFVKAIATYEHVAGGFGSVTTLQSLLSLLGDRRRSVLDWILVHTDSYWYYGYGAKSISQYDAACTAKKERAAKGISRDLQRQMNDKVRIAESATTKLYNAVRRGDIKAVRALIAKGADPCISAPDGTSLYALALAKGNNEIANGLQHVAHSKQP